MKRNRRATEVTVLANCPAEGHAHIKVRLTQGTASGEGHASKLCTGTLAEFRVTVHARGRAGFTSGPAEAQADAMIRDRGEVVDTQEWTRQVELAFADQ